MGGAGRGGADPAPTRDLALPTREITGRFTGKDAAEVRQPLSKTDYAVHSPRVAAAPPARDLALRRRSGGGTYSARGLYAKRWHPRTKAAARRRRRQKRKNPNPRRGVK